MDFTPAETIECADVVMAMDSQWKFSSYVTNLLDYDVDIGSKVDIWDTFKYYLDKNGYLLGSRSTIKSKKLMYDLEEYYEQEQIPLLYNGKGILTGIKKNRNKNALCICYIGYFLNIPIEELANPIKREKTEEELFQENLTKMIADGLSYAEVGEILGISSRTVYVQCKKFNLKYPYSKDTKPKQQSFDERLQAERQIWLDIQKKHPTLNYSSLYKFEGYRGHLKWLQANDYDWMQEHYINKHQRKQQKSRDWLAEDKRLLPMLKEVIKQIENTQDRPQKVSSEKVMAALGYKGYYIRYFPLCKQEIEKHLEPYPKFWAREATYAIRKLQDSKEQIFYSKINKMVGLDRRKIAECIPYVEDDIKCILEKFI
jgi:hypothetical protein